MLKAFSWPDFLLVSILLSLLWWAGVWLLYFRKKNRGKVSGPLPHSWSDRVDELEEADLIGKPVLEHGVSVVEADEFSFGAPVLEEEPADQVDQLGDLADVQEEIKTVCRILAAEDGSKEDFFSLFEMVKNKYPKIAASPSLPALNGFIVSLLPFELSDQELEDLWV